MIEIFNKNLAKPEIKKEKSSSQKFMENFLKSNERNDVKGNAANNIFHLLATVEEIDFALAQLGDNDLSAESVSQALQKLKKDCLTSAKSLLQALPENIWPELSPLEEVVSEEADASSAKKALTEEVNKIKGAREALCKAITMKRLIAKFVADGHSLPVVWKTDKRKDYTAPITIAIKDCHNSDTVVVHTKVLPIDTEQLTQVDGLPFIRHGISDEGTFACFPYLKGQIPHSSYTLFSSSLDRVVDGRGIVELAGMEKIEGLLPADEDLDEKSEEVMARLSQSGVPSREQTSLAGSIKALDRPEETKIVYVTEKANGAYAACQVFKGPDDQDLLFVSSKASPLILPIPKINSVEEKKKLLLEALETLKEKRASEKRVLEPLLEFIAKESIKQLSKCNSGDLFDPGYYFWQQGMCVGEAELGDHIIPLAADAAPTIRWFQQINSGSSDSIQDGLKRLERVGLTTVNHYSVAIADLPGNEKEWRGSEILEGVVVYYNLAGILYQTKYKSIPYITRRALREFLNSKRGKELLSLSWPQQGTVLSSANRPKHVEQVIAYFLDNHPHLLALSKNTEFCSIVQENIRKCKRDFPRFIQFLLDKGCSEKDLEYGNDYGFARLYQEFNKRQTQAKGEMIKVAESSPVSGHFGGLIIALSGPPGVGKDHLAEELAKNEYWGNNTPSILSKDLATKTLLEKNPSYNSLSEKEKTKQRFVWLAKEIKQAVQANRPIIATTCNGSPRELAWITQAAKDHNLAVMPVYPRVSLPDMTAFSAALIVSVLRRKNHATLSASTGEAMDSKFAQVIKGRLNDDFYTHASTEDEHGIPASDFYAKYLSTELLSYFELSSFDEFMQKTDLSGEQGKIKDALEEVVNFIKGEKEEISMDSLTVLYKAENGEIDNIFQRTQVDNLCQELMKKITKLEEEQGVCWRPQEGTVRALKDKATYYGAFLDGESAEKLKAAVKACLDQESLPDWIKTYVEAAKTDAMLLKKDKKKGADRDRFLHLTLAHADLLHNLSDKASSELKNMVEENLNNGAKVTLKVGSISYNEGVMFLSDVRLLYENNNGVIEDKTNLLVASGMPHITLATREGIPPVFALYAEQRREEMKGRKVIKAENRLIKTLYFDVVLTLKARVRTDVQHAQICEEEKGRAQDATVGRQQKSKGKFIGKLFSGDRVEEANNPDGGSASSPAPAARIH
ncbi:MAG: hypothetical protein CFE62_005825 [Candidatus Aquirickettsiella gammari]|uniref:Uncharacterized protein n=1 Tax=Candidatus Aquirickettsiella gammari TaxID=2016198 RepID=A0A370CI66_9COXI|nr:MAG: hypothetical protein CFE62_005825 [Candidatus Aquirickettsiella gammari]